jgi:bifunctional DNA-binding transcriptional regulator/antitoxin component of YhaV-PrlF toxin-antitoxin module
MNLTSNLSSGRAVIPAALRLQLDIKDGDQLIWSVRDGDLVATTRRAQLGKAQALFQKLIPKNSPSLADELIAERRKTAASE